MIPGPPFSPTCKRLHWLLGYLRMSECEESGNQPTREFSLRTTILFKKNRNFKVLILQWKCDLTAALFSAALAQFTPATYRRNDIITSWYNHLCQSGKDAPLTLYPLRQTAHFSKSANKDTLPMYNISFESHWSAYLRSDISSYEGGSHFERNCFKMQKWTT